MATSPVTTTTNTNVLAPETITEVTNLVIGFKTKTEKKEDGTQVKVKVADYMTQEEFDKAKADGKLGDFEGLSAVTTSYTLPKTLPALVALYDANVEDGKEESKYDELVANHNRGAKNKLINRTRALLLATDDDGNLTYDGKKEVNGILDLTSEITSGSKRKFLTEEQKIINGIMALPLPDAQKQAMLLIYQQKTAVPAGV